MTPPDAFRRVTLKCTGISGTTRTAGTHLIGRWAGRRVRTAGGVHRRQQITTVYTGLHGLNAVAIIDN